MLQHNCYAKGKKPALFVTGILCVTGTKPLAVHVITYLKMCTDLEIFFSNVALSVELKK